MSRQIPIVDLFAGPGGLNEGFSRVRSLDGNRIFRTATSVECDASAHRTLELRALFRALDDASTLGEYWNYLRGDIDRETLFERSGDFGVRARSEALCAELGRSRAENARIEELIKKQLGGRPSREFVLIGGPPCQAYSLVGRARRSRETRTSFDADRRHVLYREYLRIVTNFRPAVFLMENVPGLISAKWKELSTFDLIQRDLTRAGYELYALGSDEESTARRFVVHSEKYGVPQARARLFILGVRNDIRARPRPLEVIDGFRTVRDAIADLPKIRSRLSQEPDSVDAWVSAISEIADYDLSNLDRNFARDLRESAARLGTVARTEARARPAAPTTSGQFADWISDPRLPSVLNHRSRSHMRRDLVRYFFWAQFAKTYGRSPKIVEAPWFLRPKHANVTGHVADIPFADRFRVQVSSRPATTITSHISKDGHYYIHPDPVQARSLTVREAARLQTFPDNYLFEGNTTEQYRQVGNAVPPYLANQIGVIVAELLGIMPRGR